ncbi:MAG: hypothetical protein KG003_13450 [Bacteroidetes bacterium]|nr:hypothetical protein [Bacteroidota bacterium]
MEKRKVVTDYSKLSEDLLVVYEDTYPTGIAGKTIRFPNAKGEIVTAVRLETDDTIYLVKVMAKPKEVLSEEQMDEMVKTSVNDKESGAEAEEDETAEEPEDKPASEDEEE